MLLLFTASIGLTVAQIMRHRREPKPPRTSLRSSLQDIAESDASGDGTISTISTISSLLGPLVSSYSLGSPYENGPMSSASLSPMLDHDALGQHGGTRVRAGGVGSADLAAPLSAGSE